MVLKAELCVKLTACMEALSDSNVSDGMDGFIKM